MRTIHTEIGILAPAERVWAILVDTKAWPGWNPFIVSLEGRLAVGENLTVQIRPPGRKEMVFRPRVVKFEPGREARWLGALGMAGLFDGEHGFRVVPEAEGRCRFEQFETFSGILSTPILWMMEQQTRDGFVAMNTALKARAEAVAN